MALFTPDVVVENVVTVDGSAVTQPVSGTVTANAGTGTFLTDGSAHTQPVSGTVGVSGSVAVTGPLTDVQLRATPVPVTSAQVTSNTANISQVVLSASTNTTLLAANANRKKVILFAPKTTLYIKFGATASSASFTYIVTAANTILEIETWIGQIDVLSTVSQTVTVTELV